MGPGGRRGDTCTVEAPSINMHVVEGVKAEHMTDNHEQVVCLFGRPFTMDVDGRFFVCHMSVTLRCTRKWCVHSPL